MEVIGSASNAFTGLIKNLTTWVDMLTTTFVSSSLSWVDKLRGITDPSIWAKAILASAKLGETESRREDRQGYDQHP